MFGQIAFLIYCRTAVRFCKGKMEEKQHSWTLLFRGAKNMGRSSWFITADWLLPDMNQLTKYFCLLCFCYEHVGCVKCSFLLDLLCQSTEVHAGLFLPPEEASWWHSFLHNTKNNHDTICHCKHGVFTSLCHSFYFIHISLCQVEHCHVSVALHDAQPPVNHLTPKRRNGNLLQ